MEIYFIMYIKSHVKNIFQKFLLNLKKKSRGTFCCVVISKCKIEAVNDTPWK